MLQIFGLAFLAVFGVLYYLSKSSKTTKRKRVLGGVSALSVGLALVLWGATGKMDETNSVMLKAKYGVEYTPIDAGLVMFAGIAIAVISIAYIYFEGREKEDEK